MIKETLSFLHKTFVNLKVKQLLKGVYIIYLTTVQTCRR